MSGTAGRRPRMERKRPALTVTGTAELVLEPQIRKFRGRLYVGATLTVLALGVVAYAAVKYLSVVEPMLAAEGANAARAIVYEMPPGAVIQIPIEPRTDLLRFVIHAYGKEDMALTPHTARLQLDLKGDKKQRKEEIKADLPGLRSRVTPEKATMGVGDPMPFEVDVHDVGVGTLTVKLAEIAGADGLLVRAYRREQLSEAEVALRDTALDREKKNDLAQWTWELGWDELTAPERATLLQARWRRLGALRGATADLKSTTIAIAPPPVRESPPTREELLGRVALRGDERIAMIVHPAVTVRFLSDEATVLTATSRDIENKTETKSSAGSVEVGPFDGMRSIELAAARDVLLEVRSANAAETEWVGWSNVYRVGANRPVVIDSPDADRVVRVSVRKAMPRNDPGVAKMAVAVDMWGVGPNIVSRWNAEKPRSRVDRYEDYDSIEAPSERAYFFLAMPRGEHARVSSVDGTPLDISLAELDTTFAPMPMPIRPPDSPAPLIIAEVEDAKTPWVPRRPSNISAFDETTRKVVRTAHWFAPAPPPPPPNTVPLAHLKHTDVDRTMRPSLVPGQPEKIFDGIAKPFDVDDDPRRPLFVPITAEFDSPTKITVRVERDPAYKMKPGLFSRWTMPRTMDVGPKEMRATFVIGDDVPVGGKLRLRITADSKPVTTGRDKRGHQLVLLPWASNRAVGPRWLQGAFEE
jgi:hypothetical protein